jgi:catechol 2,3-dioxygenase-like lactoylglutathione lyase family enzyme
MTFSHVTVGVSDIARARRFYDAVLGELGLPAGKQGDGFSGWGAEDAPHFFVTLPFDGEPARAGNGVSVSFLAPSRAAVDGFWQRAMEAGATDEGRSGLRPHYHPNYYAAYVRDPDGNKIAAVCHDP